jgi:hypothetical protein
MSLPGFADSNLNPKLNLQLLFLVDILKNSRLYLDLWKVNINLALVIFGKSRQK